MLTTGGDNWSLACGYLRLGRVGPQHPATTGRARETRGADRGVCPVGATIYNRPGYFWVSVTVTVASFGEIGVCDLGGVGKCVVGTVPCGVPFLRAFGLCHAPASHRLEGQGQRVGFQLVRRQGGGWRK